MKILFLTNELNIGGIETNLVRLAYELSRRGHQVIAATRGGQLVSELEAAGGRHAHLSLDLDSPPSLSSDVRTMQALLSREDPDVVHVFSASTAILYWVATRVAALRGKRLPVSVATIMGLVNSPEEPRWKTTLRAYLTTLGADRVMVVSPAIAGVVRRLPVSSHRIVNQYVVGVDLPDWERQAVDDPASTSRQAFDIPEEVPVITTIGRLNPSKSHELFLTAARQVLDAVPQAIFLLVGGGPLDGWLRSQARALGIERSVRFLGPRSDVLDILRLTDVYVRPGIVEGFAGITVLEAQSVSTPVVSFDTADVRIAIEDGISGVIVPNGSSDALAAALVQLVTDPALAQRIGEAGRISVERTFAIGSIVDGLEELYGSLVPTA